MNPETVRSRSLQKPRVLIVEDEATNALMLEELLVELGYAVAGIAATADDAVRKAEAAAPDLILMDVRLRGERDGIEAAAEIRNRLGIPSLFLTAYADVETVDRACATAPAGYVVKPFQPAELRSAIEIALIKHRSERELRRTNEQLEQSAGELQRTVERLNREMIERMRTADELARHKAFLASILDSIQDGIWVMDRDRKFLLANRTMTRWFPVLGGVSAGTLTCGDIIHPHGRCDACAADASLRAGTRRSLCCETESAPGRRSFEIHAFPLTAADGATIGTVEYLRDVTEQKRMEENLAVYQEQLRSLSYRIAVSEKQERRRIAQDLHDSIPQTLAFCKMKIQDLRSRLETGDSREGVRGDCDELTRIIDGAIAESRNLMFKLAPPVLYELGLEPALEQLLRRVRDDHGIDCSFSAGPSVRTCKGELATILYGIALELVNNVVKHASADRLSVEWVSTEQFVSLTVRDNGAGFLAEDTALRRDRDQCGFGLFSIGERTAYLKGTFAIHSEPGRGTEATVRIPTDAIALQEHQLTSAEDQCRRS